MAIMEHYFKEAHEELKRVDHLIFVSLKYTRTVDVLKNVLKRLIMALDCVIDGALEKAKEQGKVMDVPKAPIQKCKALGEIYNEIFDDLVDFYLLLRKINRADYDCVNEFRRHVALIAHTEDQGDIEVNIDVVTDYFRKAQSIIEMIEEKLKQA